MTIIQPVLGWNSDYGSAWGIAAWNCCVNGQVNESTPSPVNAGDHLLGYVFAQCGDYPLPITLAESVSLTSLS